MQSKKFSWLESLTSTAIGYKIALVAQIILFPLYGIHISTAMQMELVMWFTIISVIRGYFVRRLFERIHMWRRSKGYE